MNMNINTVHKSLTRREYQEKKIPLKDWEYLFIHRKDLIEFNPAYGEPCEVCKKPMAAHQWGVLDHNGYMVDCSFVTQL